MSTESPAISPETWKQALLWIEVFKQDWHGEVPTKLHTSQLGDDGAPQFSPEFDRYLNARDPSRRNPDDRLRTTRAFRKLRRKAPREFDVLYMVVVHHMSIGKIATELTARAIRLEKPERYTDQDARILMLSGLDKVIKWW